MTLDSNPELRENGTAPVALATRNSGPICDPVRRRSRTKHLARQGQSCGSVLLTLHRAERGFPSIATCRLSLMTQNTGVV